MGLIDFLSGIQLNKGGLRVGLDTALFIYYIEDHPQWAARVAPIFEGFDRGDLQAFTSELTLLETLVLPYRVGDQALTRAYEHLLTRSRGLTLVPIDRQALRSAALLRARLSTRTPDALQLAAALENRCHAFITNDRRLPKLDQMKIVQLSELG